MITFLIIIGLLIALYLWCMKHWQDIMKTGLGIDEPDEEKDTDLFV